MGGTERRQLCWQRGRQLAVIGGLALLKDGDEFKEALDNKFLD